MKTQDELRKKLDETQRLIDAAETAMRLGFTLEADSVARYMEAMERQKQIAEEIGGGEQPAKGLVVSSMMREKESELCADPCVIEAVEELSEEAFRNFQGRLLRDSDFILDHTKDLLVNRDGRYHCLLRASE